MPERAMRAMAIVQEEIFAADRVDRGRCEDFAGEGFVGSNGGGSCVVLRIPRTSSGAEMQRFAARGDAEQQPCSAVEIAKFKSEFGAGERRINRLVRIEARLSRSKLVEASHAISFDAVTQ